MRRLLTPAFAILLAACAVEVESDTTASEPRLPIRVVVVAMFERGDDAGDLPGEFQHWVERLPLEETLAFPAGNQPLRHNPELGVLGLVTGIGTAKSAASVMALGLDDRFDLSRAYWLFAGIAGIDPEDGPVGSAVWADYVVDGDLAHQIDAREIPEDWQTGYIPLRMSEPYALPRPATEDNMVFRLNRGLVDWAFDLTKNITLEDSEPMANLRALYTNHPAAQQPPQVLRGDQLAGQTYWHGALFNDWANDWVDYWTDGEGRFVTSAMEDSGSLTALARLDAAGIADLDRALVLRTASNYTMQYDGVTAAQSLSKEKISGKGYSAFGPSLEALWQVGSPIVMELTGNWAQYQEQLPGERPQ